MDKLNRGLFHAPSAWGPTIIYPGQFILFRYSIALVSVGAAFCASVWTRNLFHHTPLLFYYVAVLLSAWFGGIRPGLLATILSGCLAEHIFLPGRRWHTLDDYMQIALFLMVGVATTGLTESIRGSEKKLHAKLRQEVAVSEAGRRALAEDDLQPFLDYCTQLVAQTLRVEYCKVLRLVPRRDQFLLISGVGWKAGAVGTATIEAGSYSQAGYTLQSGVPIVVENIRSETRFSAPQLLTEHKVVSGLSVTIVGEDGPFGVLGAHSRAAHAFTLDDIHFIQSMANVLALFIQRRRSMQLITESETRFRTLAEVIPQMVWTTDAGGMVDYISSSWCRFTGLTMAESLGREGWKRVLYPEDASRVLRQWTDSLRSGQPYEVECRLRAADGAYRWILARGIPFHDADGAIRKWFGTCTDIHNQRLAEEELRKSEKLAATAQIASAMAHEINNPLAGVTNALYLLHTRVMDKDPTSQVYVQIAERELARVTHISNQVLGLYRESSTPVATRIPELLDRVIDLYAGKTREKRVTIIRQYSSDEELIVKRGELRHLFSNLLVNALEAVPVRGTIAVRVRPAQDLHRPGLEGVRVMIADNGPGISPEHRRKIFEPFFTTKSTGGAGLGLWIAQCIIRDYQGAIRVRSTQAGASGGAGTVISVFLPKSASSQWHHPPVTTRAATDTDLGWDHSDGTRRGRHKPSSASSPPLPA